LTYGWLVTVERRLTLCVFPVFSVAVMEKCCDACGDGEYYFRSKVSTIRGDGVSEASTAVDRKSTETYGWLVTVERRRLSVYFLYLAWRLWKSVVTLAVTGVLFPVEGFDVPGDGVSEASTAVDRKSMDLRLVSYSGKTPDFLCISCI
jgi:hypothetical protein